MLKVLNIAAIVLYAMDGFFLLAIRFFADQPADYNLEMLMVDLSIAFCFLSALGLLLIYKQVKTGLFLLVVSTCGLLFLGPFTERALYAPAYLVLTLVGYLAYRRIGKPVPAKKVKAPKTPAQ